MEQNVGYAFVEFLSSEATDAAVKLTGEKVDGRPLRVDYSNSKTRRGTGGGGDGFAANGMGTGRNRGVMMLTESDKAAKKGIIQDFKGSITEL